MIEDLFKSNNFTVYLLSIVFSSAILIIFILLYFITLTIRCCLQKKEKQIRSNSSNNTNSINRQENGQEIKGISTILQFDPFNYEEEKEEFTCNLSKNVKCWIGMEILYFIENLFLLFVGYALITYISSLVAFQYLHWGAGISINLFLTIIIVIHGVRYRLIDDKLQTLDDLDNEQSNDEQLSSTKQSPPQLEDSNNENNLNNLNISNDINGNNIPYMESEEYNPNIDQQELQNITNHNIVSVSNMSMTPTVSTPVLGETLHLNENSIVNTSQNGNIDNNITNNGNIDENEETNPLTKQRSKKVILRKEELHHQLEFSIIDGPPPLFNQIDISNNNNNLNNNSNNNNNTKNGNNSKKLKKQFNFIEKYFKSLQYGITTRFIIFITYLIISMIITIILTSFFYGSCICLNEFEFSTTFTRYVQSNEGQNVCLSESVCSLTLLLNEKPQNEFIIKFFTQSRPISSFIVINNTNMVNRSIQCSYQDLNEIETELVQRYVHTCILNNLNENTVYNFKVGFITINGSEPIYSDLKKFKTFSNNLNNNNLNFIQSSEFGYNDEAFNLLKLAISKYNPKFIAISGNLVFDNGFLTCYTRWVKFLTKFSSIAIDSNSNLIPLLTSIGNYEALFWKFKANYGRDIRPYKYFILKSNNESLFNNYYLLNNQSTICSLLSLDSWVVNSHQSQIEFINNFYGNQIEKFRMVMYSMPLFPSLTDMEYEISKNGRTYWSPLFSKHNVTLSFEGYDRVFKRSKIISNNEIISNLNQTKSSFKEGTTFIGDGAMGGELPSSLSTSNSLDYFEKRSLTHNFKHVTCNVNLLTVSTIDSNGNEIDYFERF